MMDMSTFVRIQVKVQDGKKNLIYKLTFFAISEVK